jgi:hypothetical protein
LSLLALAFLLADAGDYSPLVLRPFEWKDHLQQTPSAWSIENLLEMGGTTVVMSNIESGGFSKVDPLKMSVLGDSYLWSSHTLDGVDISDPIHAGAVALRVPFRMLDSMAVRYSENAGADMGGLDFKLAAGGDTQVGALYTTPTLGGLAPGAVWLMDTFSGQHALQRDPPPPATRRHFDDNVAFSLVKSDGRWRYGAQVDLGTRRFNAYDSAGFTGTFAEPFAIASFAARYEPLSLAWHAFIAGEYRSRTHVLAEQWLAPAETPAMQSVAVSAGVVRDHLSFGATIKYENTSASGVDFVRELHDIDGQGLNPYSPRGHTIGLNLDARYELPLGFSKLFVHANDRVIAFLPSVTSWSNPQAYDGAVIGRIDFRSQPTLVEYGNLSAGFRDALDLGKLKLSYALFGIVTGTGGVFLGDIGVKAQAQLTWWKYAMPFIAISRAPVPISGNVALALAPGYLEGSSYSGDTLTDTTGGSTLSVSRNLLMAKVHTLAIGIESHLAKTVRFSAQVLGKTFDDTYWMSFASKDATTIDGDRSFLTAGDKRYTLGNFPWGEKPFYVGLHAQLVASDPKRYLVSIGAAAFFSLGTTAFGYGPLANDMGIIDPSMASPNARSQPVGNLENDRAYYVKSAFAVRFISTLWGFLNLRYHDGKPFAAYSQRVANGQLATTYQNPKGSLYTGAGPREDAHIDMDLKLGYTIDLGANRALRLEAMFTNVYDLGSEIAERQDKQVTRASLELQIPRTGFLSAELLF